ncbi:MAG: heparinase II/III family protein [Opitutae bacterium]|nr:heparinase II/III family protein [Opitutae bacterium]
MHIPPAYSFMRAVIRLCCLGLVLTLSAGAQVMDDYFKQHIANITEEDFWSSIEARPELAAAIAAAIAAGKSGQRDTAYRLMGEYHRGTLAAEAADYRERIVSKGSDRTARIRRESADKVLRREIVGWANQTIQFGPVIDFNANFGRSGQYGFHYLGWLRPEIDHFVATQETKYRDDFIAIVKQYYGQRNQLVLRIAGLHPVYYELGARAKSHIMIPAYAALAGDPALDTDGREALLKLLIGFARALHRMQDDYRPGNWQIVGAVSLYHLGVAFPEFGESASWRQKALATLRAHAEKDFFADGGHGERCWGYGHMSLGAMAEFYNTAKRYRSLDAPALAYWQTFLQRGYQWFALTTAPGLFSLNYGDGGIASAEHIIAEAKDFFPELAAQPGVLGIDRTQSAILRPSGYAFMRAGDAADAPFLSVNFGGWGGGHTHMDLLDFSIWRYGQPLIEEVGRFGSYDNPLDPFFRSEASHNQIVLENIPMNRKEHAGQDVLWRSTPAADFFSGWHGAYSQARVQRQIVYVKPDFWVMHDTVSAKEYIFQASHVLHGVRPFRVLGEGRACLEGDPSCLVIQARPEELRRLTTQVDYEKKDYPNAPSHGMSNERHRLTAMQWRNVGDQRPITFTTLLLPFRGETPPAIQFEPVEVTGDASQQAAAYKIVWQGQTSTVVFNPAGAKLTVAGRTIDARMAAAIAGEWIELQAEKP